MTPVAKSFVRVYRAANSTEAYLLKGLLEHHGIPVRMFGEGLSSGLGDLPAEVVQVDIEVPAGFRQYARELLDEYESRTAARDVASVAWICDRCRESNPPAFDVCWSCSTSKEQTGGTNG